MSQYFAPHTKPEIVKTDLDPSNYATKSDLNSITHIDTSSSTLKTNLAALKTEVDKLDIDKLIPVPGDLSKLSKEGQEDFTKKTDFSALKTKVDGTDTTKFILKSKYDTEVGDLKLTTAEGKIPDISGLATKTQLTTVENKIPDISNLETKTQLAAVENKIPDANGFVKKNRLCNRN